jgi:general secretion pathway protein I
VIGYVLDRIRRANGRMAGAGLPGRGEGGFTLLEVLVALAILGISVTVIFQLFSANMRAVRGSEDYISAAVTAQTKMRQVMDDEKLAEKNWSETTVDGYRVDVVVADTLKDRTKDLEVQLLEVILTVHWTKNSKTKAMTVRGMKMIPRGETTTAGTTSTKKSPTGTTVKK